jgi:endonuclease III
MDFSPSTPTHSSHTFPLSQKENGGSEKESKDKDFEKDEMKMGVKKAREEIISKLGGSYTSRLGINPEKGEREIFKWWLASVLFGAPIREETVIKTFKIFIKNGLDTPSKILDAGWEKLVELLDEGGYTRYDFKTADKLLEVMKNLSSTSLQELYTSAKDERELEERLRSLGKGVGPSTVNIFLRELRGVWDVAPPISTFVVEAAKNLGIELEPKSGKDFVCLEASLLRLGKNFCRKKKCGKCPVRDYCITFR